MLDISIGQIVRLNDSGIEATVRFFGETLFAPGVWVGVELATADGKNDGSVNNQRYFECDLGRGIFIRPTGITVIAEPPTTKKPKNEIKKAARPSSVSSISGKRPSIASSDSTAIKRMNMNSSSPSPKPAARNGSQNSNILRSPSKTYISQPSGSGLIASNLRATPPIHGKTQSMSSLKSRQGASKSTSSMPPPPKPGVTTPKVSTGATGSRTNAASNKPVLRKPSFEPKLTARSIESMHSRSNQDSNDIFSPKSKFENGDDSIKSPESFSSTTQCSGLPQSPAVTSSSQMASPDSMRQITSPVMQQRPSMSLATNRSIEDLKTKIRVMEKKAMENRDKMKHLEKVQEERDRYEAVIQKMQTKYQPQQQEILSLRKRLKETETKLEQMENSQAEHELTLEMATLDREMAEETAEVLKTELDALKLKTEELELEVEVLREENAELGNEMSPEEKTSHGWLQMERNNERMREALIRLRDMTQQTEAELREEIKSLQEDLQSYGALKEKYGVATEKLTQTNAAIEDLKQQLDNAMGAEDMIEELSEKNIGLQEELEELKATIADFETLKEISDEVEINHVEIEKEMQSEIDYKESIIQGQKKRANQQEQVISDMEYTLLRFRELVTNMQSDLDDMRASHAVTEAEAEQLNSRSRAIFDLNRKLQLSAAKTQIKTIDLELRRLDAQEASEHLAIVQLFLPDTFKTERDSILVLLRFKRVGLKAHLLHDFVKERMNTQPSNGHENSLFVACEVLDKLCWVAAMCDRFVKDISRCNVNEFITYEGALYELEPVERALNSWIDGLRKDELKETQCACELQRTIALMSHLSEVHISGNLESFADKVYMKSVVMQNKLENAATAVNLVKNMVQSIVPNQEENDDISGNFSRKSDAVISQTRNSKVIIGKIIRALEELNTRSLSLTLNTLQSFENCELIIEDLAKFSQKIGVDLFELLHVEGRSEPFTYLEVQATSYQTTSTVFAQSESEFFSVYSNKLRILVSQLTDLYSIASDLTATQEFERPEPPWVLRSRELKSIKKAPVDAEDEIRRLKEDNNERGRLIARKDQSLEESAVKIELLESRMRDAALKNNQITELEHRIEETKKRELELIGKLESKDKELTTLDADCKNWRKAAEDVKALGVIAPSSQSGQEQAVATAREIEALMTEIRNLQAAVRYLCKNNYSADLTNMKNIDWLQDPLIKPPTEEEKRQKKILSEGRKVLSELLNLNKNAKMYDLETNIDPNNKLAWRPAKSTPQYHVARQREDYEAWRSWKEDLVRRAQLCLPRKARNMTENKSSKIENTTKMATQVKLNLPEWEDKLMGHKEVTILEPHEFESFKETLGFA